MQKMAQEWFSGGSTGAGGDSQQPASSLLADWNSYAASQSAEDSSSSALGFDLESAVRFANDTVSGTFSVTLKLPSGVRIQEIVEGQGPAATEGDLVEINYVCHRTNGYFVHSTVDQFSGESTPVVLPLDKNQIIKGLEEVLVGMRIGGKRRALIPPSVGYTTKSLQPIPEEFGPRRSLLSHVNEPLIFKVQLLKLL